MESRGMTDLLCGLFQLSRQGDRRSTWPAGSPPAT